MHHPSFTIDKPGTDSWRHAKAGAKITVTVGDREIAILRKIEASSYDLKTIFNLLEGEELDIVILEGFHSKVFRDGDIFKIVTARTQTDLLEALEGTVPPIIAISGPVVEEITGSVNNIPVVDTLSRGEELFQLVDRLVFQRGKKKSCNSQ